MPSHLRRSAKRASLDNLRFDVLVDFGRGGLTASNVNQYTYENITILIIGRNRTFCTGRLFRDCRENRHFQNSECLQERAGAPGRPAKCA